MCSCLFNMNSLLLTLRLRLALGRRRLLLNGLDHHVHPPVQLAAPFGAVVCYRIRFAHAHGR